MKRIHWIVDVDFPAQVLHCTANLSGTILTNGYSQLVSVIHGTLCYGNSHDVLMCFLNVFSTLVILLCPRSPKPSLRMSDRLLDRLA